MAVALLFYNMKVDNSLIFALEKKLGEKYEKLFKKDESVVMECLNGTPKVISPILSI